MHPWYRGFRGSIESNGVHKYKLLGNWDQPDEDTLVITELPVRVWTQTYREQIETWMNGTDKSPALVKDYIQNHTDTSVYFTINLTAEGKKAIATAGVEKTFKLGGSIATSNMVCFDVEGKIKKYGSPEEVCPDGARCRADAADPRRLLRRPAQVLPEAQEPPRRGVRALADRRRADGPGST